MTTTQTKKVLISSGIYQQGDKQFHSLTRSFYKVEKAKIGLPIVGTVLRQVAATEEK
jgi:hypothetical protein